MKDNSQLDLFVHGRKLLTTNDILIEDPIQANAYVGEICINGTSNSKS
jgi:hypothetical protein